MIDEYAYLWTDPIERYVLVQLRSAETLIIWDRELDGVLVIEDDEVHRQVIERMVRAGVPTLEDVP